MNEFDKYRILLDESSDPIFSFERDGTYTYVNNAFASPLRKKPEDIIGKRIWDVFSQDEADKRFTAVKYVFETGDIKTIEVKVPTQAGDLFFITTVKPVFDENRKVTSVICISKNITEWKRAENEVRAREALLSNVLGSTADGILVIDDKRRILIANRRFQELWRIPDELMQAGSDGELIEFVLQQLEDPKDFVEDVERLYESESEEWSVLNFKDGRIFERYTRPVYQFGMKARLWSFRDISQRIQAENSLRKSQSEYKELFENSPAGNFILDDQGNFTEMNSQFCKILGYSENELKGMNIFDTYPEDMKSGAKERFNKIKDGERLFFERPIIRKDGAIIIIEARALRLPDGRQLAVVHDITSRRRAEEELRESEFWLKESQRVSRIGNYVLDIKTGSWNSSEILDDLFGIGPEYIRSVEGWIQIIHPDHRQMMNDYFLHEVIGQRKRFDKEYMISRISDGETRWVHGMGELTETEGGALIKMTGTIRDITKRKLAEIELQDKTEQLDSFFNLNLDLLCIADMDGNFIRLNKEWEKTLGYKLEDMEGKRFLDFIHPDDITDTLGAVAILSTGHKVINFVNRYRRKDGGYRWIEWRSIPKGDKLIYAVARDITDRKLSAELLETERNLAQKYFDMAGVILVVLDKKGVVQAINKMGCSILKYEPHFIIGKNWFDLVLRRKDVKTIKSYFSDFIEGKEEPFKHGTGTIVSKDEEERLIEWRNTKLTDISGNVIGIVGSGNDITEKSRTENALRISEEQLRMALKAAKQGLYDLDVTTGKETHSAEFAAMLEYEPDEFYDSIDLWIESVHPDDREGTLQSYNDFLRGKTEDYHVEFRQKNKSGKWVWILSLGSVVERDKDGNPLRIMGTRTDITQLKEAEDALRQSEAKYKALIENIPDFCYLLDLEGRIVFANHYDILNQNPVGKNQDEVFPSETAKNHLVNIKKVISSGLPFIEEETINFPNSVRTIETRLIPIKDISGKTVSIFGITRDISDKKRDEEIRVIAEKLQSLGTLAGGIAHDFNNLLAAILGNVQLAMLENDASEIKKHLALNDPIFERVVGLTHQLLTFSKGGEPRKDVCSTKILLESNTKFFLSGTNIKIEYNIPNDIWDIYADAAQIGQVIQNLTTNARDAMPHGGNILISAENIKVGDVKKVKFSVHDTGSGIPDDVLPRIFDPYFTTKKNMGGSGLGLSVCYSIIKKHGGEIYIESTSEQGTVCTALLPAADAVKAKKIESVSGGLMRPVSSEHRVLVVDDEEIVLRLISTLLKRLGYQVETVKTSERAIEVYKEYFDNKKTFDIVIMDLTIPGSIGGEELISELLKIDPNVKAVVSSGYSESPVISQFRKYGFKAALSKPYRLQELASILSNVIQS